MQARAASMLNGHYCTMVMIPEGVGFLPGVMVVSTLVQVMAEA